MQKLDRFMWIFMNLKLLQINLGIFRQHLKAKRQNGSFINFFIQSVYVL